MLILANAQSQHATMNDAIKKYRAKHEDTTDRLHHHVFLNEMIEKMRMSLSTIKGQTALLPLQSICMVNVVVEEMGMVCIQ